MERKRWRRCVAVMLLAMRSAVVVVAFLSVCSQAAQSADPLGAVVARFYPTALTASADPHHRAERREQAFASFQDHGTDFVVAAYSGGHAGAVALIERSPNGSYVADDVVVGHGMQGTRPDVYLVDVDRDGVPEAEVSFQLPRGGDTVIFRVVQKKLVLISPGGAAPLLGSPKVLDLGGKFKDLVDAGLTGRGEEDVEAFPRYVLSAAGGRYVEAEPLDFYRSFDRARGTPLTENATFEIPEERIGKRFRLIVVNGDEAGGDFRAAAGRVWLNGVLVASPGDFSPQRDVWSVPVTLQRENTLAVRLEGKPKGRIGVVVAHD